MSYPPHAEWGHYIFTFPCTIHGPIYSVRLDFVDRWTRRVRGTLTAWHGTQPKAIIYQNGILVVKGQMLQHTRHARDGVADIFVTLNGSPSSTFHSCQAVWYENRDDEGSAAGAFYAAQCADPLLTSYTEGHSYTIDVPCTVPGNTNRVRLDFKASGVLWGSLDTTSFNQVGDVLFATGTIARYSGAPSHGMGAADISVTVNDGGTPTCSNCRVICYKV